MVRRWGGVMEVKMDGVMVRRWGGVRGLKGVGLWCESGVGLWA